MPKTRAYTREELQGLRRADLQRLCKTYDIKGANAKSNVLVDLLAEYFTSPAYISSPRPETRRRRIPAPRSQLPKGGNGPARRLNQPAPSSAASGLASLNTKLHPAADSGPAPTSPVSTNEAGAQLVTGPASLGPRPSGDELAALRQDVSQLRQTLSMWEDGTILQSLEHKVEERLATAIARQMRLIEEREAAVVAREAALDSAWARLEVVLGGYSKDLVPPIPTSEKCQPDTASSLKKRKQNDHPDAVGPVAKRQCIPMSDDRDTALEGTISNATTPNMTTLSSARQDVPRTPSPPQHGVSTANARDTIPPFATSPQPPSEPYSPTIDKPDRAPRAAGPPPILSGSHSTRPHHRHSRRKPSQAHIDLSAITESEDEPEVGPSCAPPVVVPINVPDQSTVSPPALSPSPAIGGVNFNFTATMAPRHSASPRPANRRNHDLRRFSPAREYMNVALNGLANPHESPSALATPGSRTIIGTERFRDTRFADEPLVQWHTPTVDLGPETPTH